LVLSEGNGMFVPIFVRDLRITQAQLAFLSACDTAGPDPALVDEPLNLASAFHLAGFRSVIGTLWHTADSAETASAVYSTLTAAGTRPADTSAAAFVLNETLRRMRDAYPAVPTRWAAHVHVGG
jgi:CHAT domain-containing protein